MKQEIKHAVLVAALLGIALAGCQKQEEVPAPEMGSEAPAPMEPAPETAPMEQPAPMEPAPMEPAPMEPAPMEPAPGDAPTTPPAQ